MNFPLETLQRLQAAAFHHAVMEYRFPPPESPVDVQGMQDTQ